MVPFLLGGYYLPLKAPRILFAPGGLYTLYVFGLTSLFGHQGKLALIDTVSFPLCPDIPPLWVPFVGFVVFQVSVVLSADVFSSEGSALASFAVFTFVCPY